MVPHKGFQVLSVETRGKKNCNFLYVTIKSERTSGGGHQKRDADKQQRKVPGLWVPKVCGEPV